MKFHATGAGQAVVQLDVNYGIDYEPNKDKPPKVKECSNYQMTITLFDGVWADLETLDSLIHWLVG